MEEAVISQFACPVLALLAMNTELKIGLTWQICYLHDKYHLSIEISLIPREQELWFLLLAAKH